MNNRMKSFAYDIDTAVKNVLDGGLTYDGLIEEVGNMENYLSSEVAWAQESLKIMVRPTFIAQIVNIENDFGIHTLDVTWFSDADVYDAIEDHIDGLANVGSTFWKVTLTYYSPSLDKWVTVVLRDEVVGEDF